MKLFTPVVAPERFHKNFTSVLPPFREAERVLLETWANGFVDRDGKFIEEFQTTFNSSFWEIYLHAVFKEYRFAVDWKHATPDFVLASRDCNFVVEAATANSAQGKPNEWDKTFSKEELESLRRFKALNTEAIIRLSNAIIGKVRKYEATYKKLSHVRGKPFVIAIAPFEQPHFNYQHDRPIRALLYDHYVDEDAYLDAPDAFPHGPPSTNPTYSIVEQLAETFGCSYPAAASRYATLAKIPCAFVTMENGMVRYAARSMPLRRANAWIPPKIAIPNGSVAYGLRATGTSGVDTDNVNQDIWFNDWESGLELSEICRHYQSSDTTLSLLWFEEYELPNYEIDRFGKVLKEDPGLRELTGELPWPDRSRRKK